MSGCVGRAPTHRCVCVCLALGGIRRQEPNPCPPARRAGSEQAASATVAKLSSVGFHPHTFFTSCGFEAFGASSVSSLVCLQCQGRALVSALLPGRTDGQQGGRGITALPTPWVVKERCRAQSQSHLEQSQGVCNPTAALQPVVLPPSGKGARAGLSSRAVRDRAVRGSPISRPGPAEAERGREMRHNMEGNRGKLLCA